MFAFKPLCAFLFVVLALFLTGCQTSLNDTGSLDLTPVSFTELPGWNKDKILTALPAMKRSCQSLLRKDPSSSMKTHPSGQGSAGDWHPFCQRLLDNPPNTDAELRHVIQQYLKPYQATCPNGTTGCFTGYDEPELRGSKRRHGRYLTPLYRLPGKKVRYKGISRSRIVKGALRNKGLELVWVDDPVDAFFLQVQGSGRVRLEDGSIMRVGYAGQNGCPYYAIGNALIKRGVLSPGNVSRQSIRKWLKQNPSQAEAIMSLNKSYVFFKVRQGEGPIGAHGVVLTPKRSLAVDKRFISLGTPLWVDLSHPDYGAPRIQSLVVAQDTGGAIKGPVRGDLFWGCSPEADDCAGRMNSQGEYYLLLPK